jgi:hypothetical protein
MMKVIDLVVSIVAKFPKFFGALVVLTLLLGPHPMHSMLAQGWDTATTVVFGSPGIPINKWLNN